jgi:hypothetical protein
MEDKSAVASSYPDVTVERDATEQQLQGMFAMHVGVSPRAYRDRFALT